MAGALEDRLLPVQRQMAEALGHQHPGEQPIAAPLRRMDADLWPEP